MTDEESQQLHRLLELLNAEGETESDKFRDFLRKLPDYLTEKKPSETLESEQTPKTETSQIPKCRRRIYLDNKWWCVQTDRKGLNRLKEIPLLEICKICKLEKYQIPKSSEVKIATQIRDPSHTTYKDAGMIYCPQLGNWIFPSKCQTCKTKCNSSKTKKELV